MATAMTPASKPTNNVLKFLSLGLLIPHTIAYTLLAAVARRPDTHGHVFFGPAAVVVMEFGKILVSIVGTFHYIASSPPGIAGSSPPDVEGKGRYSPLPVEHEGQELSEVHVRRREDQTEPMSRSSSQTPPMDFNSVMKRLPSIIAGVKEELLNLNGLRLIAPAILYVCQNNLQIFSAGHLTPAEYQVVGQTKLAFTAVFSVLILGKRLTPQHWVAIATLAAGTVIVQTMSIHSIRKDGQVAAVQQAAGGPVAKGDGRSQWDLIIGTTAMLGASACSGLGGVLVEALLKKKMAFWTTNVHLAFFSLLPACIPVLADAYVTNSFAPFRYFTTTVWSLIGLNILGGIIASMTMKYADNILKNFAVAISLVGTVFLSALVSGIPVKAVQLLGTAMVVGAIGMYARA